MRPDLLQCLAQESHHRCVTLWRNERMHVVSIACYMKMRGPTPITLIMSYRSNTADRLLAKIWLIACAECNRFKGTDFAAIDQMTGATVPLFNPRIHRWSEHFDLNGARIAGVTVMGRVTVDLLRLNTDARLLERETLIAGGRYPPSWIR